MSAKYSKIKWKLIKAERIKSRDIEDYSIRLEDILPGSLNGSVFADYSISADKLSDEVTKQGNVFNIPNRLTKLDNEGNLNFSGNINIKSLLLKKSQIPQVSSEEAAIYYNESDSKIHIKFHNKDEVLSFELNFVSNEKPIGEVNGINKVFVLNHIPIANSERIYINGIREKKENYTINQNVIIFNEPPFPEAEITEDYCYI